MLSVIWIGSSCSVYQTVDARHGIRLKHGLKPSTSQRGAWYMYADMCFGKKAVGTNYWITEVPCHVEGEESRHRIPRESGGEEENVGKSHIMH